LIVDVDFAVRASPHRQGHAINGIYGDAAGAHEDPESRHLDAKLYGQRFPR
jgi:hypothetical protein